MMQFAENTFPQNYRMKIKPTHNFGEEGKRRIMKRSNIDLKCVQI